MDPAAHKRTFHTLDAMRGIGAVLIAIHHAPDLFGGWAAGGTSVAVDLFFAMSGIVISRAYEGRFARGMSVAAFLRLRLIRLYPLYLVGLVLGALNAAASLWGHGILGWTWDRLGMALVLGLAMLPGPAPFGDGRLFALNIPAWTLFFELVVNIGYAALLPRLTNRRLLGLCLACVPALLVAACLMGDLNRGALVSDAAIGLLRTVFSFSAGLLIGRTMVTHRFRRSLPGFLLLVGVVVLTLLLPIPSGIRPFYDTAVLVIGMPLMAVLAIHVEPPRWLVPACTASGLVSYAVYMIHVPVFALVASLAGRFGAGGIAAWAPVSGCVILAVVVGAGWLLDRCYDAPLRRILMTRVKDAGRGGARNQAPLRQPPGRPEAAEA